jgi:hypothetical protein
MTKTFKLSSIFLDIVVYCAWMNMYKCVNLTFKVENSKVK